METKNTMTAREQVLRDAVQRLLDLARDPAGSDYTLREVFGLYGHAEPQSEGVAILEAMQA